MNRRSYDTPSGNPDLGPESGRDLQLLDAHITKWWGEVTEVIDENRSEYVHIDLYVVPATDQRRYHTIITTGMSDRPMRAPQGREDCRYCELLLALPPEWPIKKDHFADERVWWPFRQLKEAARLPHMYDTWVWYGHTLSNGDPPEPYAPDVEFCGGIFSIPVLRPDGARRVRLRDDKEVFFFVFIPIFESELRLAWEHGANALFERLDAMNVSELVRKDREKAD